VADVLAGYLPGLTLLRDYDAGRLDAPPATVPGWQLTIDEARSVIAQVNATKEGKPALSRGQGPPALRGQQALHCAAALFITFLARKGILTDALGSPRLSNNALAAVTLLVP